MNKRESAVPSLPALPSVELLVFGRPLLSEQSCRGPPGPSTQCVHSGQISGYTGHRVGELQFETLPACRAVSWAAPSAAPAVSVVKSCIWCSASWWTGGCSTAAASGGRWVHPAGVGGISHLCMIYIVLEEMEVVLGSQLCSCAPQMPALLQHSACRELPGHREARSLRLQQTWPGHRSAPYPEASKHSERGRACIAGQLLCPGGLSRRSSPHIGHHLPDPREPRTRPQQGQHIRGQQKPSRVDIFKEGRSNT